MEETLRSKHPEDMVWYGCYEPLVVLTRWDLLGVAVDLCRTNQYGTGVGYIERSVGKCLCIYLLETS